MNQRKLIFSSGIANIFEWYDYALFAQFAPIIGAKFFPESEPSAALLNAFMIFAIGYFMRPIGGIFFGSLGDRFGRRAALSASIICMSFPTALIGILPTYDSIGLISTALMIVVRMLQGLSMGGALTGSISFIMEHTTPKHRGLISSIPMSGICIGFLLSSSVAYSVRNLLSPEQFDSWGWRLPFLFGILIIFAGIYIRLYTEETPLFKQIRDSGKIVDSPLKNTVKNYWLDMLISVFINSTGSVIFYLQAVYLMSFLKINRGLYEEDVSNLSNICYMVMAIITILSGWLSDKIGRPKIFAVNLILIIVVSPILIQFIDTGTFVAVAAAQIVLSILAASYIGPEPALQAEFYPTNIRNTALSISYNIATSVFGGTAPFISEYLLQKFGSIMVVAYYLMSCALLSSVALYFYTKRLKKNLLK